MNLPAIKADLLRKVFVENPATAPSYLVEDILTAVNSAGEFLNMIGFPFWMAKDATEAVDAITAIITIEDARGVHRVARASDGVPLFPIADSHGMRAFGQNYRVNGTHTLRAYRVLTPPTPDAREIKVEVGPAPIATGQSVEVSYTPVFEPYAVADLDNAALTPEMPAGYVTTLFLPVARYFATRSHWFSAEELEARLNEDYGMAIALIRRINPKVRIPAEYQRRRPKVPQMAEGGSQ